MGGAGYPTAAKVAKALGHHAPVVIGNGVECDPGVSADAALISQHSRDIVEGLEIVGHILATAELHLALPGDTAPSAFLDTQTTVRVHHVRTAYPQGAERNVISQVLGRAFADDTYPADEGVVVVNVATLFAICEAVRDGYAPSQRIVTLPDGTNQWVDIDGTLAEVLTSHRPLRIGGPVTGRPADADTHIDATTNAISFDNQSTATACIRCGWCTEACPIGLDAEALYDQARGCTDAEDRERMGILENLDIDTCYECGACVAACPSRIPLLDTYRAAKRHVQRHRAATTRAAQFEARYAKHVERAAARNEAADLRRTERIKQRRSWE